MHGKDGLLAKRSVDRSLTPQVGCRQIRLGSVGQQAQAESDDGWREVQEYLMTLTAAAQGREQDQTKDAMQRGSSHSRESGPSQVMLCMRIEGAGRR